MEQIVSFLIEHRGDGEGMGGSSAVPLIFWEDLGEFCHLLRRVRFCWGGKQNRWEAGGRCTWGGFVCMDAEGLVETTDPIY